MVKRRNSSSQQNLTMASIASLGSNLPTGITGQLYPQVTTVTYPTPRVLNANAFQPSMSGVAQQVQQNVQPSSTKQRVFTGTVTKVHDNFGFVDEDVFFQTRYVRLILRPSMSFVNYLFIYD